MIILMQGRKEDIEIDEAITYSLASDTFSKSLKLQNKSQHIYVFKVKTNQRSVISMQLTHDFIKPGTTKEIVIKLAEKPSESTPLRLEFNYAIPSEEEIRINDSKMNSYTKDAVFRKIITITRDDSVNPPPSQSLTASTEKGKATSLTETVNVSNQSFSSFVADATEEVKPVFKEKKEEVRVERVESKPEPKVEPRPQSFEQVSIKYPNLSAYVPRQVESEQITVITGKSTEINIAELIQQPPKATVNLVNLPNIVQLPKGQYPSLVLSQDLNSQNFSPASQSPAHKRTSLSPKRASFGADSEKTLRDLGQRLQRQKSTVLRLKSQQSQMVRSDCVYPVPLIYLIVLSAFFSGSLLNWLLV